MLAPGNLSSYKKIYPELWSKIVAKVEAEATLDVLFGTHKDTISTIRIAKSIFLLKERVGVKDNLVKEPEKEFRIFFRVIESLVKDSDRFRQVMLQQDTENFTSFLFAACKMKNIKLNGKHKSNGFVILDVYCERLAEL